MLPIRDDGLPLQKHIYFVAETKGTLSELPLRKIEQTKIACAKKFFVPLGVADAQYHVTYRKVASYGDLLTMANSDSPDAD